MSTIDAAITLHSGGTVSGVPDKQLLTTYIYNNLAEDIQKIFVDSFMLTITAETVTFPVSGDDAQSWLGYVQKSHFKRFYTTEEYGLKEGTDYVVNHIQNPLGGRPLEVARFTVNAFKKLGMLSNTSKGSLIRSYYLVLENLVLQFTREQMQAERDSTKKMLVAAESSSIAKSAESIHNTFLDVYDKMSVVYLALLEKLECGKFVGKIGWTESIKDRGPGLVTQFGFAQFMFVIPVIFPKRFEDFLHKHTMIEPHKYKEKINGLNKSNEAFLMDDALFKRIRALMKREVKYFNALDVETEMAMRRLALDEKNAENDKERIDIIRKESDARMQNERARVEHERVRLDQERVRLDQERVRINNESALVGTLQKMAEVLSARLGAVYDQEKADPRDLNIRQMREAMSYDFNNVLKLIEKNIGVQTTPTTVPDAIVSTNAPDPQNNSDIASSSANHVDEDPPPLQSAEQVREAHLVHRDVSRGNYIQKYDPETRELLAHFVGATEAVRHLGDGSGQRLVLAAKARTLYKGFRWFEVPRDDDPTVGKEIGDTVESQAPSQSKFVAMFKRDDSEIEEVFVNQKAVRDHLQIKSSAAVSKAISQGTKCQGAILRLWDDVAPELQAKYLAHRELPQEPERKGLVVLQLDPVTRKVIARHPNVASVALQFRMSHMTVKKACDNGEHHVGFAWSWDDR